MAGKGKGETGRKAWPREKQSRRVGWTQGPGVVLGDGKTWYLPSLDAGLIPYLGRLRGMMESIETYRVMGEEAEAKGETTGLLDEMFLTWFRCFVCEALRIQYRNRHQTIFDLVDGSGDGGNVQGVCNYLVEFNDFARRFPIGDRESLPPVGLN